IIFWMMLIQLPLALIGSDPLFLTKLHQAQISAVIGIGLSGLTSHYCLTNAFRSGDAGVVVPLDFMRIPLIAVIGWWLYGEPLDGFVFLGAGLIITGILWNLGSEARRFNDPAKPVSGTPGSPRQRAAMAGPPAGPGVPHFRHHYAASIVDCKLRVGLQFMTVTAIAETLRGLGIGLPIIMLCETPAAPQHAALNSCA